MEYVKQNYQTRIKSKILQQIPSHEDYICTIYIYKIYLNRFPVSGQTQILDMGHIMIHLPITCQTPTSKDGSGNGRDSRHNDGGTNADPKARLNNTPAWPTLHTVLGPLGLALQLFGPDTTALSHPSVPVPCTHTPVLANHLQPTAKR